ncbi:MAG: sigma-54-dependent Fis family transcriptional regulator [Candidatus Aureabacteria bacterium]|nr:sigma-54-dependent Fis family transcriptional regulator [Candidatus Auribacterota bacterium]
MTDEPSIARIVVIDDEEGIRTSIRAGLENKNYEVVTFSNGKEAIEFISSNPVDVIISDIKMSPLDGIEVLKITKEMSEDIPVILLTAYSSKQNADLALREGAFDYLEKPYDLRHLRLLVQRGIELKKTLEENRLLRDRIEEGSFEGIFGKSPQIQKVFHLINLISKHDSTVLITGESGTGKELVAHSIHQNSLRKDKSFVVVNCGAIPEQLLESELFGHKKGSFTGAINDKKGLFEEADGGTIFLDEISTMPLSLQVKILRVLQEKEVRKVGDTKVSIVDVRVIAASNEDLSHLAKTKKFRQDLYYRISVVPIHLPPLREREGDIPILVEHFLQTDEGSQKFSITPHVMKSLLDYSWPGNVRELENVIERLKVLSPDGQITHDKLPETLLEKKEPLKPDETILEEKRLKDFMDSREKDYIRNLLQKYSFDKKRVAEILDITLMSLYRKIEKYQLTE